MPEPGEETDIHDIPFPDTYDDFVDEYGELLEKVDAGLAIVVNEEDDLDEFEGGDHNNVMALVKDDGEGNAMFMVSENGEFEEVGGIGGAVDGDQFVDRDGDSMTGTLDLSDGGIQLPDSFD